MIITPFTLIAYLFILFSWSRALLRYRDQSISLWGLFLWSLIWAAALVAISLPRLTEVLATQVGIGRGVDAVVYISIIILFYLLFRLYIKVGMVEREFTRLVRSIALRDAKARDQ